ncbi:hypothetical protein HPB51_002941 [Rhipicephalus microplus]|uniref:MH2 domain-containing protein n=1 Tax=Rhipicephalus microplus TaxID=6941 RepID=A0A9J6DS53_RHIMP|nr:hypothetical protein HPB51_002941 [Rhipicephalus microplus]
MPATSYYRPSTALATENVTNLENAWASIIAASGGHCDHIQEVLNKWGQIDDEIWAKIICMERNRRVAKAYARASVLTINGSNEGFDGYRIGLCGFDNPMRDPRTEELKKQIGHAHMLHVEVLVIPRRREYEFVNATPNLM